MKKIITYAFLSGRLYEKRKHHQKVRLNENQIQKIKKNNPTLLKRLEDADNIIYT